jgi:hypothetical protein
MVGRTSIKKPFSVKKMAFSLLRSVFSQSMQLSTWLSANSLSMALFLGGFPHDRFYQRK